MKFMLRSEHQPAFLLFALSFAFGLCFEFSVSVSVFSLLYHQFDFPHRSHHFSLCRLILAICLNMITFDVEHGSRLVYIFVRASTQMTCYLSWYGRWAFRDRAKLKNMRNGDLCNRFQKDCVPLCLKHFRSKRFEVKVWKKFSSSESEYAVGATIKITLHVQADFLSSYPVSNEAHFQLANFFRCTFRVWYTLSLNHGTDIGKFNHFFPMFTFL